VAGRSVEPTRSLLVAAAALALLLLLLLELRIATFVGLASAGNDIVFRFIIEYSTLRDS